MSPTAGLTSISDCLFPLSWLDMTCCVSLRHCVVMMMMFVTAGSLCKIYDSQDLKNKSMIAASCCLFAHRQQALGVKLCVREYIYLVLHVH